MKNKMLLMGLAAVMIVGSAAGCTPKQQESTEGKVVVSIGEWPTENRPAEQETWQSYIDKLSKTNPDIVIQPDEWAYDVQTFMPKAVSGQLPTMYNCHLTETKKIIDAGYSADITDVLEELGYKEYMNPQLLELCEKDGRYYGVPSGVFRMGLACNTELFKQAGLVDENGVPIFPQTWEELAETASVIKQKTGQAGFVLPTINNCGGWHFMNIAWSYGVEFMKQDGDKWIATFDTPECVEALQFVKDLKWKYNALPDNTLIDQPEMQKLFAVDQGAMYMTIGADVQLTQTYGMPIDRFAYTIMPAGPKGRYSLLGGKTHMFSPNATPEQIRACFEWLKVAESYEPALTEKEMESYLENRREQLQTQRDQGLIVYTASTDVWNIPELTTKTKELAHQLANIDMRMVETSFDTSMVNIKPEEPMNCQDLYSILDSCIQEVLLNQDADPAALIKQANSDFQKNYLDKAE